MNKKRINYQDQLLYITILFFVIGVVNISLAVLGLLCFVLPFVLYFIERDRVWCKYYCPRAGLFNRVIGKISLHKKLPKFINNKRVRNGVLIYFIVNTFIMIMSTIAVANGKVEAIDHLRFLILFRIPLALPQIVHIASPDWLVHLGYRVYSMMLTSTLIGIVLGIIYMPRAWCTVCPVQTGISKLSG